MQEIEKRVVFIHLSVGIGSIGSFDMMVPMEKGVNYGVANPKKPTIL